jgi:5-formyltetrahydrofolate cyclo-ligase
MAAPHISEPVELAKQRVRAVARQKRAACDPAWGVNLADVVLEHCRPSPGAVVGGFWPLPGEIDVRPLLFRLAASGQLLALPVTPPRNHPLEFRRWAPGEKLAAGRFGTLQPFGASVVPDWVLVPLLAFDRAGRRLGYGGGYYDRTLAAYPNAYRLGIAFAAQELPVLPEGPHDIRLPRVATERGLVICDSEGGS